MFLLLGLYSSLLVVVLRSILVIKSASNSIKYVSRHQTSNNLQICSMYSQSSLISNARI